MKTTEVYEFMLWKRAFSGLVFDQSTRYVFSSGKLPLVSLPLH